MRSRVRVPLWAVAALMLSSTLAAFAADLDIISTMSFESGGRKYIEPCVHNNTAEARQAQGCRLADAG